MFKIISSSRILYVILFVCLFLTSFVMAVKADSNEAVKYAKEAADYAAQAYDFANKINYNSSGRIKYYARQAMEAAKKAEAAANKAQTLITHEEKVDSD